MSEERAIYASGCFWGVQYHFNRANGVLSTDVGYIGGHNDNPAYKEVCSGTTGHAEAIDVHFDNQIISFEDLTKLFFETHDPTHVNRQGPDMGTQYRTEIFYFSDEQKSIAEELISHPGLFVPPSYHC